MTDIEYAAYEGTIGDFTSHQPKLRDTGGKTTATFAPQEASSYQIVVPRNDSREGSYGLDSTDAERAPASTPCRPQAVPACA